MTAQQRRVLHNVAKRLRLEPALVTDHPIRLRIGRISGEQDGDVILKGKGRDRHYLVRIDSRISFGHAVHVLFHEWAHALAWDDSGPDHGPEWGIAYSNIWRLIPNDY